MSVWQMLGTLIEVVVLMEVILDKEITTPAGDILGISVDIELDLIQDKVWLIVEHKGWWRRIPGEQIAGLTDRVALVEGWLPVNF